MNGWFGLSPALVELKRPALDHVWDQALVDRVHGKPQVLQGCCANDEHSWTAEHDHARTFTVLQVQVRWSDWQGVYLPIGEHDRSLPVDESNNLWWQTPFMFWSVVLPAVYFLLLFVVAVLVRVFPVAPCICHVLLGAFPRWQTPELIYLPFQFADPVVSRDVEDKKSDPLSLFTAQRGSCSAGDSFYE